MDARYRSRKRRCPDAQLPLAGSAVLEAVPKKARVVSKQGKQVQQGRVAKKPASGRQSSLLRYAVTSGMQGKDTPPQAQEPSERPSPTPSSTGSRAARSLLWAGASKDIVAMYAKLPPHYALLADMFGKLQTVQALQASRGQRTTLQNCAHTLDLQCNRRFTESHLAQLKYIFPEAVHLDTGAMTHPSADDIIKAAHATWRLSFGLEGVRPGQQEKGTPVKLQPHGLMSQHSGESAISQEQGALAEKLRQDSMSGLLPVSLAALKAVSEFEVRQQALIGKEASALRRHTHALAMLPHTFDSLRSLFGTTGPSTRPLDQVAVSIATGRPGAKAAGKDDIILQLQELSRLAPQYLTIEPPRQSGTVLGQFSVTAGSKIVRVNRRANMQAVRQLLQRAASERHGSGALTEAAEEAAGVTHI
ncbi:hypothetical protein WJX73_001113 [Symbiochloris irregularis]|uniref:CDT1 Geminin-binding domain-containing protein n=1 Tax=Symbiochloris irregularis TaxID=706552 RepID=A0AAW1NQV7_9CHLO